MQTGEIEVRGTKLFLLNPATDVAFAADMISILDVVDHGKLPKDDVLSKYRHLALRHPEYSNELRFRSQFLHSLRLSLESQSFIEVETPLLTRSSPEVLFCSCVNVGCSRAVCAHVSRPARWVCSQSVSSAVQADPDGKRD